MGQHRLPFRCTALILGVCGAVALGLTPGDERDYLRVTGPSPLRYRVVATSTSVTPPLPSLPPAETNAVSVRQPAEPPAVVTSSTNLTNNMVEVYTTSSEPAAEQFSFLEPQASVEHIPLSGLTTADIVGFLSIASNNVPRTRFIVPVFVPPQPPQATHSSRATYEKQ